jgi:hypothetical protein
MSYAFLKSDIGGYFFDVIFREEHNYTNEITQNPVQSGAAVNDHVYQQPVTLNFDVGVSDCLGSIVEGQFDGFESRGATALAIFQLLWRMALPLVVNEMFNGTVIQYTDMVVKTLRVVRDRSTHTALKMTIGLQQVIKSVATTVAISPTGESSDPQTTGETNANAGIVHTEVGTGFGAYIPEPVEEDPLGDHSTGQCSTEV